MLINGLPYLGIQVLAGQFLATPDSAAAPGHSWVADPTTGIYNFGAGVIGMSFSGVAGLKFSNGATPIIQAATGGGFVQWNNPGNGSIGLFASGANQNVTVAPSGTGDAIISVPDASNGRIAEFRRNSKTLTVYSDNNSVSLGSETNHPVDFFTNFSISRMRLAVSGNLLIGGLTTDGTGVLQFATGTSQSSGITFRASRSLIYSAADGTIEVDSLSGASLETALNVRQGSTVVGTLITSGGNFIISSAGASSLLFKTNSTTFLTGDSTQNTIAKGVVVHSNGGTTVAALPAAASYQGAIGYVTDATQTAITGLGLTVVGGGANKVMVYSDGVNWKIL